MIFFFKKTFFGIDSAICSRAFYGSNHSKPEPVWMMKTKSEAMRVCSPGQPCSHVAERQVLPKNWWLYQGLSKNILISNIRRCSWFNRFHLVVRHFVFSSDQVVLPNIFSADVTILREAFQTLFHRDILPSTPVEFETPKKGTHKKWRIKHQKPWTVGGTYGQHQLTTTGRMFSGTGQDLQLGSC